MVHTQIKRNAAKRNYQTAKFSCQRGGLMIRGVEYRPQGDNLPVAIISHAFMMNRNMCRQYAELFADMGYASYIFDFCGGSLIAGKSDGKTTDMSVTTEKEDLKAVIDYVRGFPYVNQDNITLMGCSQGGLVSALVAAEQTERIKKLVLFYPALCIPDDARAGRMMLAKFDPRNPPEVLYCGPMKLGKRYITDVINMAPYQEISKYLGDVLLVYGTADKIVGMDYIVQAEKVYCERTAGSIEFRLIKDASHIFSKAHDLIAMEYLSGFIQNK